MILAHSLLGGNVADRLPQLDFALVFRRPIETTRLIRSLGVVHDFAGARSMTNHLFYCPSKLAVWTTVLEASLQALSRACAYRLFC
jgi:hypothetical protein